MLFRSRLIEGKKTSSNHYRVAIEITNELGQTEVVHVNATIQKRIRVVATTRALMAGHIIQVSDVTLQEVRVECFFPADDRSDALFRSLAAKG